MIAGYRCSDCGEVQPLDAMCACDRAREEQLRGEQVDAHPEPGGHHVFRDCTTCDCGLVYNSPEYMAVLSHLPYVTKHRRYLNDRIMA